MIYNVKIDPDDVEKYRKLIKAGSTDEAITDFIKKYIAYVTAQYADFLYEQIKKAQSVLTGKQMTDISIKIGGATASYTKGLGNLFEQFMVKVYNSDTFRALAIKTPAVQRAIKKNIINLFNKNIEGALLGTPREIVTTIRSLQKDILKIRNVITDAEKLGELTAREMAKFKSSLFKKLKNNNPKYYNMLENN